MKKQKDKTTKTSFLTKFKNTKMRVKVIIVSGILTLVTTAIVVPVVVTSGDNSSKQKPNVNNKENDNQREDEKKKEQDNQHEEWKKTDKFVQWNKAYMNSGNRFSYRKRWYYLDENSDIYINNKISTKENSYLGNKPFSINDDNIEYSNISKLGIDEKKILKNIDKNKFSVLFIRFLGYDFGTSKTFANIFYQLEDSEIPTDRLYYETIIIKGFGKPKIAPNVATTITKEEFKDMVLPSDFSVSSDLATIGMSGFADVSFAKDAKFSLAQTQVKAISNYAFSFAALPNGFALNPATTLIKDDAFHGVKFEKEAKFSLDQTQVKSISAKAFFNATLPNDFALSPATNSIGFDSFGFAKFDKNAKFSLDQTQVKSINYQTFAHTKLPDGFALNSETTSIGRRAFQSAYLNPGFKIPNTVSLIAQDSFQDAILPSGYVWYDKGGSRQTVTATNYPKAGWYVGKI